MTLKGPIYFPLCIGEPQLSAQRLLLFLLINGTIIELVDKANAIHFGAVSALWLLGRRACLLDLQIQGLVIRLKFSGSSCVDRVEHLRPELILLEVVGTSQSCALVVGVRLFRYVVFGGFKLVRRAAVISVVQTLQVGPRQAASVIHVGLLCSHGYFLVLEALGIQFDLAEVPADARGRHL